METKSIVKNFFLQYQEKWIKDNSRLKIMEKSRQIGISMTTAYKVVRQHIAGESIYDTWISSRDELQAKLFIEDCRKFVEIFRCALNEFGKRIIPDRPKTNSLCIDFNNNTSVHSLSSNADAQSGKRGSRVLDEFALHNDQRKLYAIAYPGITWGGQLEIVSTHRGSLNFFNKLIQEIKNNDNPKNFSYHRVTLEDALNQGFLKKLKNKLQKDDSRLDMNEAGYFDFIKKSVPDEESFLQEYMCQPIDDRSVFLQSDLVEACEYSESEEWEITSNRFQTIVNQCFLGVDIGRTNDLTVFWLLEKQNDIFLTRNVTCLKNTTFTEQEKIFYEFFKIPSLVRVCIDQTGIGRQFVERAQSHFGKYKIDGITFTNTVKEQLAYCLRSVFEEKILKIPSDQAIRSDLRSIKRETTFSGNIRFAADRSKNGHADRFWALALAVYASNSGQVSSIVHCESIGISKFSTFFNNR